MADPTPKPSLMEMYTNLQSDPQDHRRKAAFIALCWQHIHQHIRETPDWILRVRNGSIQLANRIEKTPYRPKHLNWNQKLNEIAYSFAVTLGPQIWPDWDWRDLPAHITRFLQPGTANMRGTEANYTVTRLRTQRLVSAGAVITEEIALLESRIGSNTRGFLRCLLESSMPIPLEQPTRAVDLLPAFLNIIHLQPRQQPFSKRDNRLTPISDIIVGEDKDLEEGEIRESPRNRPQPPNSEGRRRLDVGVEVEAEEDEVAEQPVRKRPCMISPAGLAQYQSMLSGSIHRRPDSLHTSAVRSELVGSEGIAMINTFSRRRTKSLHLLVAIRSACHHRLKLLKVSMALALNIHVAILQHQHKAGSLHRGVAFGLAQGYGKRQLSASTVAC